ncbi:DUF2345 domain-containing protein, partial [Iodobacter arcticus]
DKDLKVTACKGLLSVSAKDEILVTAGGGYIRLKGGDIEIHCPGEVSIKGATHDVSGPAKMNPTLPIFPDSFCKSCMLKAKAAGSPFAKKSS